MEYKVKTEQELKEFFKELRFEESTHTYYVNGIKIGKSVSGKLKTYYEEFNAAKIAPFSAKKLGISTDEVLALWAAKGLEATTRGTKVHSFGEHYAKNRTIIPNNIQEEAIKSWFDRMPPNLIPIAEELRAYHLTEMYAGTADGLLYNSDTGKYIIYDFKTNASLDKNYKGKKMLSPFNDLLDCSYNKYQIQLSYYKILLEQVPGLKVERMIILWLPHEGGYEMRFTEDLTDRLIEKW